MRHEVPELSAPAAEALEMLQDPDFNLRILAGVLAEDPGLAARVLKIGRSPYYKQRTLPSSVQSALQVIGLRDLRNIIFTGAARGLLRAKNSVADALWSHSLAVALAARALAYSVARLDPQQAFLAGLLHDGGQMLFMRKDPSGYSQLTEEARREKIPLVEAERRRYGESHEQAAMGLLLTWNLDSNLADGVAAHHGQHDSAEAPSIAALLTAADYLSLKAGLGFFPLAAVPSSELLSKFGLANEVELTRAATALRQAFDTEGALLNTR